MSEAGASKTPSGGYNYICIKSLQIDALLYSCSVKSRVETETQRRQSLILEAHFFLLMGKGKCVFLNLAKGVSSDKSKNLTKAIGK